MNIYRPPFGYDMTDEGELIPIEDDLEMLQEIAEFIEEGSLSIRECALWLSHKASRTISYEGLRKRLKQPVRIHG